MKKIVIAFLVMFFMLSAVGSKAATPFVGGSVTDYKKFGIGAGIGLGGFIGGPTEVNDWISDKYSQYIIEEGTTDIMMHWDLSLCVMYRPVKFFSMNYLLEMAVAPKLVAGVDESVDAEAMGYNLGRYSIIAEGLFNIPLGTEGSRFLIGGGPSYHHIYFENAKDGTLGVRAIPLGFAFGSDNFETQLLLGADFLSKGISDNQPEGPSMSTQMELDYNSYFVHVNVIF